MMSMVFFSAERHHFRCMTNKINKSIALNLFFSITDIDTYIKTTKFISAIIPHFLLFFLSCSLSSIFSHVRSHTLLFCRSQIFLSLYYFIERASLLGTFILFRLFHPSSPSPSSAHCNSISLKRKFIVFFVA